MDVDLHESQDLLSEMDVGLHESQDLILRWMLGFILLVKTPTKARRFNSEMDVRLHFVGENTNKGTNVFKIKGLGGCLKMKFCGVEIVDENTINGVRCMHF